jgi:hypothetical protein
MCRKIAVFFSRQFRYLRATFGLFSMGGVGVDVMGSGTSHITIPLCLAKLVVAKYMLYIPLTFVLTLHNASTASLVLVG